MSSSRQREERTFSEQVGSLVDERLLELLSRKYPDRAPTPGTPLDKVWFDAGAAELVRFLRECLNDARRA